MDAATWVVVLQHWLTPLLLLHVDTYNVRAFNCILSTYLLNLSYLIESVIIVSVMWCSMLVSPVALAGVHRPQQFQILRDRWSQAPPQVRPELAAAPDRTPRLPCWRTLPSLVGMPLTSEMVAGPTSGTPWAGCRPWPRTTSSLLAHPSFTGWHAPHISPLHPTWISRGSLLHSLLMKQYMAFPPVFRFRQVLTGYIVKANWNWLWVLKPCTYRPPQRDAAGLFYYGDDSICRKVPLLKIVMQINIHGC